jgi:NAD(P)-dependent dehydrogenase (short-subunit alcohol dehydrogenase family)
MMELEGKTALVTGAGRRLGRSVSLALAARGMNVVVHYLKSRDEAEEVARGAREAGVEAWTLAADLADDGAARELVDRAMEVAGPLYALVNNASIFPASRLLGFDLEELERNVRVNAFAPLVLSRAFAAGGRGGAIVNFLDSRVVDYDREHAAYHLSKRMLYAITRMASLELAPAVRVNAVAPGLVLPPPGEDRQYLEARAHTNPLGRVGTARDVAAAVTFLLECDFVTGQVIFVDGGRHLFGSVYG